MLKYKDQSYYLEASLIDKDGSFLSGQTITYKVYKSSNNSLFQSGSLSEVASTGVYTVPIIFLEAVQYRIEYYTPTSYENGMEIILIEENTLSDLYDKINRILGLSQENYKISSSVYDTRGSMTSALIKTYSTATDCNNDTNPLAQYQLSATYNNKGLTTSYKVVKI